MKKVWQWCKQNYLSFVEHKYSTLAGALTFFLVLSLVPFSFWLVLLFGNTGLPTEEIFEIELFDWSKELMLYVRRNAVEASNGANIFLLATTLWSSSAFFYHLRKSGEIIYRCGRKGHGFKIRLIAIALTGCVLLYFSGATTIVVMIVRVCKRLPKILSWCVTYFVLFAVGFLGAWLLNDYVCPYRCSPKNMIAGSLLTSGLWIVASFVFLAYFHFGNRTKLYGALSLLIVFLLWLYWMMICFTIGVIFNRRRIEQTGKEK